MLITAGFDITIECLKRTPVILLLSVHPDRRADLVEDDGIVTAPSTVLTPYHDKFGNLCHRLVAPAGVDNFSASFTVADSGLPDPVNR